jgi:hypothetical protein
MVTLESYMDEIGAHPLVGDTKTVQDIPRKVIAKPFINLSGIRLAEEHVKIYPDSIKSGSDYEALCAAMTTLLITFTGRVKV